MSQRLNRGRDLTQDQNEELDYLIDWSGQLDDGDTITGTPVWTVSPSGSLEASTDHPPTNTTTTTTFWTKKNTGRGGVNYELECTITTTAGRTLQGHLLLRVT